MNNERKELTIRPEGLIEILESHLTAKHNQPIKVKQTLKVCKPGYHEDDETRVDLSYMLNGEKKYLFLYDVIDIVKETIDENYEVFRYYFITDVTPDKKPIYKGLHLDLVEKQMKLTKKPNEE